MLDLYVKVSINDSGIIVKKAFKTIELKWSEIIEFKKFEKGIGVWAGWRYSLTFDRNGEKQIVIAAGEGAKAVLQAHRYLQRLA